MLFFFLPSKNNCHLKSHTRNIAGSKNQRTRKNWRDLLLAVFENYAQYANVAYHPNKTVIPIFSFFWSSNFSFYLGRCVKYGTICRKIFCIRLEKWKNLNIIRIIYLYKFCVKKREMLSNHRGAYELPDILITEYVLLLKTNWIIFKQSTYSGHIVFIGRRYYNGRNFFTTEKLIKIHLFIDEKKIPAYPDNVLESRAISFPKKMYHRQKNAKNLRNSFIEKSISRVLHFF